MFASRHVVDQRTPLGGTGGADLTADGIDLLRDELAKDGEGGVHDVAAHVAEGT